MVVGKLSAGPISLTGNLATVRAQTETETVTLALTVLAGERVAGHVLTPGVATVNDQQPELAARLRPTCFLELASGSDCVLSVQGSPHVPLGCIALEEAHRFSLHVAEDTRPSFLTFLPPAELFELTDLTAEGARAREATTDENAPGG
jgi:hypothetical protein